jgi:hypothetical protein
MRKIFNSFSVILLILLLFSAFSITGCDGKGAVAETFYKNLVAQTSANLDQMKQDIGRYQDALSRKADLEAKIKSLQPAIVDLSGYWAYDQKQFNNLQDKTITMQSITAMNTACREIKAARADLDWCAICEKNIGEIKPAADKLDKLLGAWKTGYQSWQVSESGKGVFLISGQGLGYDTDITKGGWYFTVSDNSTKVADAGAQGLAPLLEKKTTYDAVKKAAPAQSYSCIPLPSTDRRSVEFWEIGQVRNDWREGSSQVSSVTSQYPEVSKFWTQLTEIGYKPSFKGGLWMTADRSLLNLYFQVYIN